MNRYIPLIAALLLALIMTAVTSSAAIVVFALIAAAAGLVICRILPGNRNEIVLLFSLAMLLRCILCYGTWSVDTFTEYSQLRFCTDAIRYYADSFQPLTADLIETYNDAGWITFNTGATQLASALGEPHFLANMQGVLLLSSLVPPLVSSLMVTLGLPELALAGGLAAALHPMMIAYSSTLIRDQAVCCLGLAVIVFAGTAATPGRSMRPLRMVAALTLGFVVWELRSASGIYFAVAAILLTYSVWQSRAAGRRSPRGAALHALLRAAVVGVFAVAVYFAATNELVPHAGDRADKTNDLIAESSGDSLGGQLLSRGGIANWGATAGQVLVGPFPWFNFNMAASSTIPDAFVGMGAILNQTLLAFVGLGLLTAVRRRDVVLCTCGLIGAFYLVMATAAYTDPPRYSSTHLLPFLLVLGLYGLRKARQPAMWYALAVTAVLGPIYFVYVLLKATPAAVAGVAMTLPATLILYFVTASLRRVIFQTRPTRRLFGRLGFRDAVPGDRIR